MMALHLQESDSMERFSGQSKSQQYVEKYSNTAYNRRLSSSTTKVHSLNNWV